MSQDNVDLNTLRMTAIAEAVELFEGNQKLADQWLSGPVRALGDKKPNDLLKYEEGIQQVRDVIGRLEHGIVT
ncbi:MAG: antitoxin Xre/MbcA/ParS toxin-binding domain-containing protein [Marinobacter sp.]|uniref:antitoxin Xre/MbcA/ParS toxin-binding domain-containing protein n=1 Tax=Marinobacter sp. AC-23 TaxID=1879031 RepID=UPI0008DD5D75|nr:antitoxin Xre/MbcA/ParS toxin-binding domain-containing protein [Marinobacter sp. AC-23]OHY79447.1 hypothetical protein BCA33_16190 [Marinobacter sp. AC-23]